MNANSNRRSGERGYNLVEVMVAMAILASVLLSILTLFIFGRRNVYSGKQLTRANSVATRVAEDLVPLNRDTFYSAFGITNSTALTSPTIGGIAYTDVAVVSTADTSVDPQDYLTNWGNLVTAADFAQGKVTLIIEPTMFTSGSTFTTADIVKIRIVVEWREGGRSRSVVLDTVKIDRS